jgi:hypothetical protein
MASMSKKKKKPRKIPLRTQIRRMAKAADRALSEYVREVTRREYAGRCPFCGRDPLLPVPSKDGKRMRKNGWVCFHFIRRRRKIVRWELANVIAACSFCNRIEVGNPDPYRAFYIRKFGVDAYLFLVDKSGEKFEPTLEWLTNIRDTYRHLLAELPPLLPTTGNPTTP